MAHKIIKIGSSFGVTIPKDLLNKIGANQGDEVELTFNSRREVLEINVLKSTSEPSNAIKDIISKYSAEFEKLESD